MRKPTATWHVLAAIALLDAIWVALGGFAVDPAGFLTPALCMLVLTGTGWLLRSRGRSAAAIALVDCTAELIACFAVCGVLSYLVVGTDQPFVDRQLAMLDRAIGFDWPDFVVWVQARPGLDHALFLAYHATLFELIVIVVLLGALRTERLRELSGTIIIGLLLTIAISGFVPAASPYPFFGPTHPHLVSEVQVSDLFALRDGTLRTIDPRRLQGLICFPSFHVILALLFTYAVRGIRGVFPASALFNAVVILSTLTAGGHYLVDLFGGGAVTAVAIALHGLAANRGAARRSGALAELYPETPISLPLASHRASVTMRKHIALALGDRSGATAVEYGLIMGLIMVAILVTVTTLGTQLSVLFNNIATIVQNSPAG